MTLHLDRFKEAAVTLPIRDSFKENKHDVDDVHEDKLIVPCYVRILDDFYVFSAKHKNKINILE